MKYTIEKKTGDVSLNRFNLFVSNITDMEALEYWEKRLDKLKQPYVVVFNKNTAGKIVYSIFSNTRKRGSQFK